LAQPRILIKNGVLIGAPFAPLGTVNTDWLVEERWYDAETVKTHRLLYPFVLTFGEYFAQYGQISVLVLAFLPLALFLRRPASFWQSPLRPITVAAWVAIAGLGGLSGRQGRPALFLAALLLCIPLAAAGAERSYGTDFRPRSIGFLDCSSVSCNALHDGELRNRILVLPFEGDQGRQWDRGPASALLFANDGIVNQAAKPGARVFSF